MPAAPIIDVHMILRDGSRVLLSKRGSPYGYGQWHMPSGKLEPGETVVAAAVRETAEETGVVVAGADLTLVHTVQVKGDGGPDRIGFFFEALAWAGEPVNLEPDKCMELRWFSVWQLPADLIPYPGAGLRAYLDGVAGITALGWPTV